MLRHRRIGARDHDAVVAVVRARGPDLLAVDHPVVAVLLRARADARDVGTGGRLAAAAKSLGLSREALARKLGAHIYLDSQKQNVAAELSKLGGAKTILSTVTSGKAMSAVIPGLAVRGRMVVVGVGADPIEVSALDLIGGSRSVVGHASGASIDSQDTLAFSALSGVRPTIETMPLEKAGEAYDKMMRNEARFRMVLTTGA